MITPMDIHNKTFSKKLRGYADDEVNSFLEEVASDYERIYREHREAARRKMNADVVKTEGDLNLYIEKLLANFTSALNIVKAAKAARAPQTIRDAAEASVAPTEAAVEAQEDTMAEEPAAEETAQAAEGAEAAQDEPEEKEAAEEKND